MEQKKEKGKGKKQETKHQNRERMNMHQTPNWSETSISRLPGYLILLPLHFLSLTSAAVITPFHCLRQHLLIMCRTCGPWPFSSISNALLNWAVDWFFHPICLFFLYSPSPWWRSWKMRISLSNSALLSVPRLQQSWEQEESLLLSNPLAPCVKDKEHHAWCWGWGWPAPRELRGAALGSTHREVSSLWTQGLGRKVLTFSSFSFRSFLIFSKKIWLNQQRHGRQTHNLGFQDWFVPQIYLFNRATHYTLSRDSVSCPWKSEN